MRAVAAEYCGPASDLCDVANAVGDEWVRALVGPAQAHAHDAVIFAMVPMLFDTVMVQEDVGQG